MESSSPRIKNDGHQSFVSGSTVEQQQYARHFANQIVPDVDIMIVEGRIHNPQTIMPTSVPGFVQIQFDGVERLGGLSLFEVKHNSDDIACLNGLKMKQNLTKTVQSHMIPQNATTITITGETNSESASAARTIVTNTINIDQIFMEILDVIEIQQKAFNFVEMKNKYKLFGPKFQEFTLTKVFPVHEPVIEKGDEYSINDLIHLAGPAYDHRLPKILRQRLELILNFYDKYQHLGNPKIFKNCFQNASQQMPKETDNVPCLQLKFWPKDIQPFLKRFEVNRPQLYEKIIRNSSMHVIPKWSTKTPKIDQDIEFRYSFSAIERLLAEHRNKNEQILNGIARSIYFRYLKAVPVIIPSYFVKTTVLWMCETQDLSTINDPRQIAHAWIKFACQQLRQYSCEHYFIDKFNILAPYSHQQLDDARQILEQGVNLDKLVQFSILSEKQQMVAEHNQEIESFIRQLKVTYFFQDLEDYRLLKKSWDHTVIDERNELYQCLLIINSLRYVDGENNKQNWRKFRQIFIEQEKTCTNEPLFGEMTTSPSCPPSEFAQCIMFLGSFLKDLSSTFNDPSVQVDRPYEYHPFDLDGFRNVEKDVLNPVNFLHNTIASSLPEYMQPLFAKEQDLQTSTGLQYAERNLLDCHPNGPLLTMESNQYPDIFSSNYLITLLETATDADQTIDDLITFQQHEVDDESLLSQAIELSLIDNEHHQSEMGKSTTK
ncbi:unnamed protein product [Didymodactylos carnosus]|uniref:Mab-21-like HhH/H2TH-like domain-containing protein n=1 Tax=Didymodactylos carnosus TaxID=1234261 RepID=A0A814SI06_9BILA|nr:unnamed protein product [Didymodactylos carnosus]CAF3911221.1 unnamed protein product [Didymodactylos carnosus]